MAFALDDMIEGLRGSRRFFHRHLNGLKEDQWDWKPNAECKSIRDTLAHMIVDDRAALYALETGKEPDYDTLVQAAKEEEPGDADQLRARLDESFEKLIGHIQTKYAAAPLDTEVSAWGARLKLARAIAHFSSEDFYHAGQIAYIRIATDPAWDYYGSIYGE
jgi:uncharacterized damage-inducible protein DinB